MMSDRGIVSGFIGVGVHMTIQHILQHIHIASRCKEELGNLKDLVMSIELIIMHIQRNRLAFKTDKDKDTASAVNKWLKKLDSLLLQSSKIVQRCSMSKKRVNLCDRQTRKGINRLIRDITEHLRLSPLLVQIPGGQAGDTQKVIEGLGQIKDSVETLASSATTYQAAIAPGGNLKKFVIDDAAEAKIIGAVGNLEKFVIDDAAQAKIIGVLGEVGLLRQVFETPEVRNHLSDGLLLWLTVSESQSLSSVINQLCTQIATQTEVELDINMNSELQEKWLKERFMEKKKIALFLDGVWVGSRELLKGLGNIVTQLVTDHSNCKVIVSLRESANCEVIVSLRESAKALKEMGVESWMLFAHRAPLDDEKTKLVVGALACNSHPLQLEWVIHWLEKAEKAEAEQPESFDVILRLSFNAVGNEDINMQLCFLHVAAAFRGDETIDVQELIPIWMGEGLLARKMLQNGPAHNLADGCFIEPMIRNTERRLVCLRMQDPFEVGRLYVDNLAERCLIEPTERDADGRVLCFRMRKEVRDWATRIAGDEENFYSHVGNSLTDPDPSERKRIFIRRNNSSSLPQFLSSSSSEIRSLSISQNTDLTKIPKKAIGNLMSLKVLDLSGTRVRSLPGTVGCLKQLICLKLSHMPIKGLPKSVKKLGHLEILDLSFTKIKKLPSDIHMLRSLRYLCLRGCKDLLNLPIGISGLLSLQYLYMDGCSMWPKPTWNISKKVASLQSLGDLIQLKKLALQNDRENFSKGTLGSMTELDTLLLILPKLEDVPVDIEKMSKLKRLSFKCSTLKNMDSFRCYELTETETENKMKNDVTKFKSLSYLKFYECSELENFLHLQELQNLRQLEIILCPKVKNFPRKFGERGAFPSLKIFSLVGLESLEGLPEKEKENDAMPCLQRFDIMDCKKLTRLPEGYLNGEIKIRVYGCPLIVENRNRVEVVTLANKDAKFFIEKFLEAHEKEEEDWVYNEFSCNELFPFVKERYRTPS